MSLSPEFHSNNRDKIRKLLPNNSVAVFCANSRLQKSADESFPFRQDSSFYYFTGLEEPEATLIIASDGDYLHVAKRSDHTSLWDGQADEDSLAKTSGIKNIYSSARSQWLKKHIKSQNVGHLPAASPKLMKLLNMKPNPARQNLLGSLKRQFGAERLFSIAKEVSKLRMIKENEEIEAIKEAVKVTSHAIWKVQEAINEFNSEHEIAALIRYTFETHGASEGFESIVASGPNANTIHYRENKDILHPDSFVLLDIGAKVNGYSADISRVIEFGKVDSRANDVRFAVKDSIEFATAKASPQMSYRQLHKIVTDRVGHNLLGLGLISKRNEKREKVYFPYSGHFLGLDVHDVGDLDAPLAPGSVFTLEPGIHIQNEGIGVRLEDDILMTDQGPEVLSSAISL